MNIYCPRIGLEIWAALLAGWALPCGAGVITYDITGNFDTSDLLIIHRGTLQWHHDNGGAAVGRHAGTDDPTTISTLLDGTSTMNAVAWTPTWPRDPPDQIRFDAFSSTYSSLVPALPAGGIGTVTPSTVTGRGTVTVTQLPDATNDWTLIARFADGFNGSAVLDGRLQVTTVPEPGGVACIASVVLASVLRRARRR